MTRRSERPSLSDGQLEVMNVVWDLGEVTVADVWNVLSARRRVARNTVQTLLTRLRDKGWLRCRTDSHAHRFRAAVSREAALGKLLKRLVDRAFGGSTVGLLSALLGRQGVSPEEAERIRALIDQAERERR